MGFNPRLAPYSVTLHPFTTDPAGDKEYQWFKFPVAGKFLNAYVTNDLAVSTVSTLSVAAYLTKYTSANVISGTLGSWTSLATWAADTPKAITITAFGSTAQFTAGQNIRLKYDELACSTGLLTDATFQIDYVLGYDTGPTPTAATAPTED